MLSDKIQIHQLPTHRAPETPEDILSSALTALFPDDTRNQHGDPESLVVYTSGHPSVGDVKLTAAQPGGEEERRLFAHCLWNAALMLAEGVCCGSLKEAVGALGGGVPDGFGGVELGWGRAFDMAGQRVLELGAGLGLGGIVSALCGAEEVVVTDYPAPELLSNIQRNIDANFCHPRSTKTIPTVYPHLWDDIDNGHQSEAHFTTKRAHHFTRVLAADCLWMPDEHAGLARSMSHFLSLPSDTAEARVIVIAGFHTGRGKVAAFFDVAQDTAGLVVEGIVEVDVDGRTRPWERVRGPDGREDVTERKRWVVVAVLKKEEVHHQHSLLRGKVTSK